MSKVYHLPRGTVAYDSLLNMLKGYLKAGADQEFVSSGESAEKLGINKESVSRNVNFFVDFGFLERDKEKRKGGCKLIPKAMEFAGIYNIAPNGVATRQKLGEILKKHQVVDTCLKRLASGKLTSEEFYTFILTETADHKAKTNNLKTFTDLLIYATLLKQENGYFALPTEGEVPELPEKVLGVPRKRKPRGKPPKRRELPAIATQFPPFLISFTPDTPIDKIKEMVTAVLEAIDEYKKKVGKK